MSQTEEIVRGIAAKLKVLDAAGQLVEMDSLAVLDFVTDLEESMGKTIPTTQIRRTNFESIEAIVAMMERL